MQPDAFHRQQYFVAAALCLAFGVMYAFVPEPRSDAILGLATAAAGFCFGKFSNGFRRPGSGPNGEDQ